MTRIVLWLGFVVGMIVLFPFMLWMAVFLLALFIWIGTIIAIAYVWHWVAGAEKPRLRLAYSAKEGDEPPKVRE